MTTTYERVIHTWLRNPAMTLAALASTHGLGLDDVAAHLMRYTRQAQERRREARRADLAQRHARYLASLPSAQRTTVTVAAAGNPHLIHTGTKRSCPRHRSTRLEPIGKRIVY